MSGTGYQYRANRAFNLVPVFIALIMIALLAVPAMAQDEEQELLVTPVAESDVEPLVTGYDEYPDPLQPVNRVIFGFNDGLYRFALTPLGNVYTQGIPRPVRGGISNLFANLQEPLHVVNHGLQGEVNDAGRNLFRFLTNSTVGLLGIFDPAEAWFGVEERRTSFDETFTTWGIGPGPYLVMPFSGPSDLRGGVSSMTGSALHPVRIVTDDPETTPLIIFDGFQRAAPAVGSYSELREQADDPYTYFRNQYLQGRMRDEEFGASTNAE